jgi:hypothetical protein
MKATDGDRPAGSAGSDVEMEAEVSSRRASQEPPRLLADPQIRATDSGAFAVALLRSIRPHQPSAARKQRLRLNLGRSTSAHAPWFLRPTVVSTILLGGAAAAAAGSAALGYWPRWQARVEEGPPAEETPPPESKTSVRKHRAPARAHGDAPLAGPSVPSVPSLLPLPPEIAPEAQPAASPEVRSQIRSASRPEIHRGGPTETLTRRLRESAGHRSRTPGGISGEDTSAVLEAVRALRRQHDPARARRLLAAYLEQHPNGALAEEALAMSIEAALVERDGDAPALARQYLSRYPAGPFRGLAQQALVGNAPPEAASKPTRQR